MPAWATGLKGWCRYLLHTGAGLPLPDTTVRKWVTKSSAISRVSPGEGSVRSINGFLLTSAKYWYIRDELLTREAQGRWSILISLKWKHFFCTVAKRWKTHPPHLYYGYGVSGRKRLTANITQTEFNKHNSWTYPTGSGNEIGPDKSTHPITFSSFLPMKIRPPINVFILHSVRSLYIYKFDSFLHRESLCAFPNDILNANLAYSCILRVYNFAYAR